MKTILIALLLANQLFASSLCQAYSTSVMQAIKSAAKRVPTSVPEWQFRLAVAEDLDKLSVNGDWGPGILEEVSSIGETTARIYGRSATMNQAMDACNRQMKRNDSLQNQ